jgi:hypothetical protein
MAGDERFQWPAIGLCVLAGVALLTALGLEYPAAVGEVALLDVPLALALALALASGLWSLARSRWLARVASGLTALAVAWSMVVSVGYDAVRSQQVRSVNYQMGLFVAEHVPDDSLLFIDDPDRFYSVTDVRERVRIAIPARDGFRDLPALAALHLGRRRTVAAIFTHPRWEALEASRRLQSFTVCEVARFGPYSLRVLLSADPPAAGAALAAGSPSANRACARLAELEGS